MKVLEMGKLELAGKRVLIREDLNVPVKDGEVTSDARIRASLPTVKLALEKGARVILMSHLGRPEEGKYDPELSLAPVARRITDLMGRQVPLVKDWLGGVSVEPGQAVLEQRALPAPACLELGRGVLGPLVEVQRPQRALTTGLRVGGEERADLGAELFLLGGAHGPPT